MQVKSVYEKRVAALRAAMLYKHSRTLTMRSLCDWRSVMALCAELRQRAIAVLREAFQITHIAASRFLHTYTIREVQNGQLP